MSKGISRFAVFICNLLIALLSIAAVVSYFFFPLWKVDVDYLLQGEELKEMLPDDMQNIDVEEIVGEGVPLSVSLNIGTMDLFSSFTDADAAATVERAIDKNVDLIVGQLMPTLEEIAEKAVRAAAKQSVNEIVRDQIKGFLDPDAYDDLDGRVEELIGKAGFDEEYINEKTDALLDAVYADGATVDTVAETAVSTVEEVFEKLRLTGEPEFADAELTEENKTQIRDSVSDALSAVADEAGNIDMDEFVASLLLDLLRSSGETDGDTPDTAALLSDVFETETDGATAPSATEELKAEIKAFIMDKIPEGTADTVALVLKIAAGVVAFSMFTWAYLILKMIFKAAAKNPAIKLKLPIWLGWLPFLILVLAPSLAFWLTTSGALPFDLPAALEGLGVSFFSAGWVAFAAAIALIVITIPYSIFRRRLRNAARSDS